MSCEDCARMESDVPGFKKECEGCPNDLRLGVDDISTDVIYLFEVMSGQLRTAGMVGYPLAVDYSAMQFVFDVYDVSREMQKFYFEWLVKLVNELVVYPMQEDLKVGEGNRDKTQR